MSFHSSIANFAANTGANLDLVVKKVVFDVARGVISRSPVDTGRFKGNWQYGTGSAPTGDIDATDSSGGATLARINAQIPMQAAGKVHYIVNNLPYAQALEDGHSTQSPPGNMVAGTVNEINQIISQAISESH